MRVHVAGSGKLEVECGVKTSKEQTKEENAVIEIEEDADSISDTCCHGDITVESE